MAKLIPASLTGRLFVVSMLVILLFLPLAGLVLEKAYSNSLFGRLEEQLKIQAYGLMGLADEIEPGVLWLPESLPDERFNQIASGRYAEVIDSQNKSLWQSQSSVNIQLIHAIPKSPNKVNLEVINPPGQFIFERLTLNDGQIIETTRVSVIWEGAEGREKVYTFVVGESLTPYFAENKAFRETLLLWLGGLGIFLLAVDVLALFWALRPLQRLAEEIHEIETGDSQLLETEYPTELNRIAKNLNALISHVHQQRERYRNTLQDLAHSLKTPLSVLQGNLLKIEDEEVKNLMAEHITRMNNIVGYQLQRAVSAGTSPIKQKVNVRQCLSRVFAALNKVYNDKAITFNNKVAESCTFFGDENDLLEIFGNLCDNACKYGYSEVIVEAGPAPVNFSDSFCLLVIDDGEGVPEKLKKIVFQRGKRLDENNEGQGIGLSVVGDIVASYSGSIEIIMNELGKNTIQVILPGEF